MSNDENESGERAEDRARERSMTMDQGETVAYPYGPGDDCDCPDGEPHTCSPDPRRPKYEAGPSVSFPLDSPEARLLLGDAFVDGARPEPEPQRRIQSTTVYEDGSQNVAGIIAADVVGVRELVPGVAFFDGAIVITFTPERGVEMGAALLEGEGAPTWWTAFANHVEQVIRAQLEAASRRAEAAAMVQRAEGRAGFEVGGKLVHAATCPAGWSPSRGGGPTARCNCDAPVVSP